MIDDLPYRPRLNEHAMLRRHVCDGEEKLLLHDTLRAEVIELSSEQLVQLRVCDGTRDVGGILLAVAQRGAYRRSSEVVALLREVHRRGLLADGVATQVRHEPGARPLEVLPFTLRCDGHGRCCTTYGSVPFTRLEAQRALGAVPEVGGDADDGRLFLPLVGAGDDRLAAVTMRDGACSFLGDDGLCRVHRRAGAMAKPRACRIYPSTFVDDGVAIRVSTGLECPCVFGSLEGEGGDGLVPVGATREDELERGTMVVRLGSVLVAPHTRAEPAALRAWSTAVREPLDGVEDGLAVAWSLARAVVHHGLDETAGRRAVAAPTRPSPEDVAPSLRALAVTLEDKVRAAAAWRGEADRVRRLARWLSEAVTRLDPTTVAARLAEPGPWVAHERFYLRAQLFGYTVVDEDDSLTRSLTDRAVRMLVAREAGEGWPEELEGEPALACPLAAVEVMMRGQGLAAYRRAIPVIHASASGPPKG